MPGVGKHHGAEKKPDIGEAVGPEGSLRIVDRLRAGKEKGDEQGRSKAYQLPANEDDLEGSAEENDLHPEDEHQVEQEKPEIAGLPTQIVKREQCDDPREE